MNVIVLFLFVIFIQSTFGLNCYQNADPILSNNDEVNCTDSCFIFEMTGPKLEEAVMPLFPPNWIGQECGSGKLELNKLLPKKVAEGVAKNVIVNDVCQSLNLIDIEKDNETMCITDKEAILKLILPDKLEKYASILIEVVKKVRICCCFSDLCNDHFPQSLLDAIEEIEKTVQPEPEPTTTQKSANAGFRFEGEGEKVDPEEQNEVHVEESMAMKILENYYIILIGLVILLNI